MGLSPQHKQPPTLLIDADDTLWENNIYFERAIASFVSYFDHSVHTPQQVRECLNACEHHTIQAHGYGLSSFRRSLVTCFEQLLRVPITADHHNSLMGFAQEIADREIELLPAVAETLRDLASRHHLILVTKGDDAEQRGKVARSGLLPYFSAIEVLPEKHAGAYHSLLARRHLNAAETWMVGNSPRSDINAALTADLNAVFIPHSCTWTLEEASLATPAADRTLLQLSTFAELSIYF